MIDNDKKRQKIEEDIACRYLAEEGNERDSYSDFILSLTHRINLGVLRAIGSYTKELQRDVEFELKDINEAIRAEVRREARKYLREDLREEIKDILKSAYIFYFAIPISAVIVLLICNLFFS